MHRNDGGFFIEKVLVENRGHKLKMYRGPLETKSKVSRVTLESVEKFELIELFLKNRLVGLIFLQKT